MNEILLDCNAIKNKYMIYTPKKFRFVQNNRFDNFAENKYYAI